MVIIGGNHDSPSFLNAPKDLLRVLSVHVVSEMAKNPADEVIVLTNGSDEPEAIVCAIPYLRDQNIRTVEDGESIDDKSHKMLAGLKAHYADVCLIAELKRQELGVDIPLICMGPLFTAEGKTGQGDGVRELYVPMVNGVLSQTNEEVLGDLAEEDVFIRCMDCHKTPSGPGCTGGV